MHCPLQCALAPSRPTLYGLSHRASGSHHLDQPVIGGVVSPHQRACACNFFSALHGLSHKRTMRMHHVRRSRRANSPNSKLFSLSSWQSWGRSVQASQSWGIFPIDVYSGHRSVLGQRSGVRLGIYHENISQITLQRNTNPSIFQNTGASRRKSLFSSF